MAGRGSAAAGVGRASSFSRSSSASLSVDAVPPPISGTKHGPNSTFVSSGIPDLDRILGGGLALGSLVMVMEDAEAPHHLLLLRTFMAQGLMHRHRLLFASPLRDPRAFLGTLPAPLASSSRGPQKKEREGKGEHPEARDQESGLRIAWQYNKYFGEQHSSSKGNVRDCVQEFSNDFDLRKVLERHILSSQDVQCISIQDSTLAVLRDCCSKFLTNLSRDKDGGLQAGRIAIQSLCSPQCGYFEMDWDMVSFIRSIKAMVRSCNAIALITFPVSVLSPSFSKRWQHLADTLISVRAIPDEDKNLAKLLTGYQDMVGFLHIHKVAQINSQVPFIPESTTFSIKLHRHKCITLERLNQAPIDVSGGSLHGTSGICSGHSERSILDF